MTPGPRPRRNAGAAPRIAGHRVRPIHLGSPTDPVPLWRSPRAGSRPSRVDRSTTRRRSTEQVTSSPEFLSPAPRPLGRAKPTPGSSRLGLGNARHVPHGDGRPSGPRSAPPRSRRSPPVPRSTVRSCPLPPLPAPPSAARSAPRSAPLSARLLRRLLCRLGLLRRLLGRLGLLGRLRSIGNRRERRHGGRDRGERGGETETDEIASETLDRISSRVASEHDASSRAADTQSMIPATREVKTARPIGISMAGTVTQGEGDEWG